MLPYVSRYISVVAFMCVCVRLYASDVLKNCTVQCIHIRVSMRACSHTPYGLSMVWAKRT